MKPTISTIAGIALACSAGVAFAQDPDTDAANRTLQATDMSCAQLNAFDTKGVDNVIAYVNGYLDGQHALKNGDASAAEYIEHDGYAGQRIRHDCIH